MPIPAFSNNDYYLPQGIHSCTIKDIEDRLLFTEKRRVVWKLFEHLAYRLITLNIIPEAVLINGSFVTARPNPGDVDFVFLIRPNKVDQAIKNAEDEHDRQAILLLFTEANQGPIRNLTGAHFLFVPNEQFLQNWADYFQNNVRKPDPNRDPPWVRAPHGKGILYIDGGELTNAIKKE